MDTFLKEEDVSNIRLKNKVIKHDEFLKRIRKSLYYGNSAVQAPNRGCQISRPLAELTADYFSESHKGYSLNRLNFVNVGKMKSPTPCTLILSMIYLERLNKIDPLFSKKITPSELFLVSMMVSTKFSTGYDEKLNILSWLDFGSIPDERKRELERDFLNAIQWNIYVSSDEFLKKLKTVETWLARNQSTTRGWCTYSELAALMPSISIAKQLISYTIILLLSYTCSLVILCGAFSLASKVPHTHLHGKSVNPVVSSSGEAQDVSDPASMSPESVLLDVMTSPLEPLGPVKFVEPILPCYCGVCDPIPDLEPVTHHLMQMLLLEDRKKCNTNRYDGDMQEVPNATGTGYVDILRLALDFSKLKLIY